MRKTIMLFFIVSCLLSCNSNERAVSEHLKKVAEKINSKSLKFERKDQNDTVNIMRLLCDTGFLNLYTGDVNTLKKGNLFGDSIIFRKNTDYGISDVSLLFPNGVTAKFMTKDEICTSFKKALSINAAIPDFIQIRYFQKTDSTYIVQIQKTFVTILLAKDKKQQQVKELLKINSDTCIFNGQLLTEVAGIQFIFSPDSVKTYYYGGNLN